MVRTPDSTSGRACLVSRGATAGEFCWRRDSFPFVGKIEPALRSARPLWFIGVDILIASGLNEHSEVVQPWRRECTPSRGGRSDPALLDQGTRGSLPARE